jgi:hypothetical protein
MHLLKLMLSNSELILSLDALDILFQASKSPRDSLMHSKHALLELCGWIEEAQDDLVHNCALKLLDQDDLGLMKKKIKKNHTFLFDNFRELIALIIGLSMYKKIHIKLMGSGSHYVQMIATINSLKDPRNSHAHTHFETQRPSNGILNAPSMLKKMASDVHLGLLELEVALKKDKVL